MLHVTMKFLAKIVHFAKNTRELILVHIDLPCLCRKKNREDRISSFL